MPMSDRSEAYARFRASMAIDYGKWRDGEPYDIAAIDGMSAAEKAEVESELSARARLDWRDVEALERIGTPAALARLELAAKAQSDGGGAAALAVKLEDGWSPALERRFIAKLGAARLMESSLDRLFEIAEAHPTAAVRAALFEQATAGEESERYAFGAFLLYLHGHSDEWYGLGEEHRPHLLNLKGTPDEQAAARAWLAGILAAPLRAGAGAA